MLGVWQYLILTLVTCLIPPRANSTKQDCQSLQEISQTLSPPPSSPLNWSSHTTQNCCHWEGIACDGAGRVAHLSLPARGLNGRLSPSLENLTHLSYLNLSQNRLRGSLPDSRLPASVHTVDLSNNLFHGPITTSLFNMAWNLLSFNVSNNSFTGALPSRICANASRLKLLDFSFNHFSGAIPRGLMGQCSKLEIFSAGHNSLSGLLPQDLSNASALIEISLHVNQVLGNIGDDIVQLENLTTLVLDHNSLTGLLPQQIGRLPRLKKLLLNGNSLSGPLPVSLTNCTTLQELILWANFIQGDLSMYDFSNLVELRKLDLGLNNFTGKLPLSLYSCKSLTAVRLSYNQLEGQILPQVVALESLSLLLVSHNMLTNISGAIKILMGCKNLAVLSLAYNTADGDQVFPDDTSVAGFHGFPRLKFLAVSGCQLSGEIPNWLTRFSKSLLVLDLSLNKFRGTIPIWLGNFAGLYYLDLSDNLFSGQLSPQLCELPALTSPSKAENTFLDMPLYSAILGLRHANKWWELQYNRVLDLPKAIYLRNNSLTGSIPAGIGHLKLLQRLDLSYNRFHGGIPDQLSGLANLEQLDLSGNCLSGNIPTSLVTLTFLNLFNVSYNNLSGKIPDGSQLQSFKASAYEANPQLCGPPLENCPNDKGDDDEDIDVGDVHGQEAHLLYLSAGLGYLAGFGIVLVTSLRKPSVY